MEQILSQDEVDALLKGISGGEIEEPEERVEEEELEYKAYDFSQQERIVQVILFEIFNPDSLIFVS